MNTRLQVEHPITEMVTGIDLVHAMVSIAAGRGIGIRQDEIAQRGWAFEYRIYAEDPGRDFAPSIGKIESMTIPLGPGVRLDTGIYEGCTVPIHYDPMLAKLIVWAPDRERAMARSRRVLSEFVLHGPITNTAFHLWALDQPEFQDGSYTTHFVADRFDSGSWLPELTPEQTQALAAAGVLFEADRRTVVEPGAASTVPNWRLHALRSMTGNS